MFLNVIPTRFHDSERFPVIVSDNYLPEFYPNTFLTTQLRSRSKQCNTLLSAAIAIKVLRAWELSEGLSVVERMTTGNFLDLVEAESLVVAMWYRYQSLREKVSDDQIATKTRGKIRSLAAFRRTHGGDADKKNRVKPGTVACRMAYIIAYLKYLGERAINKTRDEEKKRSLIYGLDKLLVKLASHAPEAYGGHVDAEYFRLGLTYEVVDILREAIRQNAPMNPWTPQVQLRNEMVLKILLSLGIRAGELLNLRIDDIDFVENAVCIRRLPDNPEDPRLYEPNVKTRARRLRIKDELAEIIQDYVINFRSKLGNSRRHDFLVVSSTDGSPLSRTSFNYIFEAVRAKVPGIPVDFGPHICRHTWNDRFSDYCDESGIDEERERKIRCRIMGWAPGSQMALIYTKRSTQAAVDKVLMEHQGYISNSRIGALLDEYRTDACEYD